MQAAISALGKTAKESEVQGYHWLHDKSKASLGYRRHYLKIIRGSLERYMYYEVFFLKGDLYIYYQML